MDRDKTERIKFDSETKKWFQRHPLAQTTVMCCERCGLYYKPNLGHRCKKEKTNEQVM